MQQQPRRLPPIVPSRRISSSLLLQQLLYYHAFWSAAWLAAHAYRIASRFRHGLAIADPDAVRTALMLLWLAVEPPRLAAGYHGNLRERVPALVAFATLTLVPQTAVAYYMLAAQWYLRPFDRALSVVTVIMLHLELATAITAMVRMLRAQREACQLYEAALAREAARAKAAARAARAEAVAWY